MLLESLVSPYCQWTRPKKNARGGLGSAGVFRRQESRALSFGSALVSRLFRGDQFSAVAGGVSDRQLPLRFEVIDGSALSGTPRENKEGANRLGADTAGRRRARSSCLIVLGGFHRETSVAYRDGLKCCGAFCHYSQFRGSEKDREFRPRIFREYFIARYLRGRPRGSLKCGATSFRARRIRSRGTGAPSRSSTSCSMFPRPAAGCQADGPSRCPAGLSAARPRRRSWAAAGPGASTDGAGTCTLGSVGGSTSIQTFSHLPATKIPNSLASTLRKSFTRGSCQSITYPSGMVRRAGRSAARGSAATATSRARRRACPASSMSRPCRVQPPPTIRIIENQHKIVQTNTRDERYVAGRKNAKSAHSMGLSYILVHMERPK